MKFIIFLVALVVISNVQSISLSQLYYPNQQNHLTSYQQYPHIDQLNLRALCSPEAALFRKIYSLQGIEENFVKNYCLNLAQSNNIPNQIFNPQILIQPEIPNQQLIYIQLPNQRQIPQSKKNNPFPPTYLKNTLYVDEKLTKDDSLVSLNGQFQASIHEDGNLVITMLSLEHGNLKVWSSGGLAASSSSSNSNNFAVVQRDGNFVIYNSINNRIWASDTYGAGVPLHKLVLQNDGNLVLFDGRGIPVWSSHTFGSFGLF